MPLVIELRTGSGDVLRRTGESPPRKVLPLPDPTDATMPLLRGVDPYTDTYFNSHQAGWLIPELESLRARASEDEQQLIDDVIDLARECRQEPHRLLVFVGD